MRTLVNENVLAIGPGTSAGTVQALFTPCTNRVSLLEADAEAARNAASGDAISLSPSFDQFRDYQQPGEIHCRVLKSIGGGAPGGHPNINGISALGAAGDSNAPEF